jgi:hypothetical protein
MSESEVGDGRRELEYGDDRMRGAWLSARARRSSVSMCLPRISYLLPPLMFSPSVDTLLADVSVLVSVLLTVRSCVRSRVALHLESSRCGTLAMATRWRAAA